MGSRGSSLPDNVHYKRVTMPSNITLGQDVFNYLVNNDIIPDCSMAYISLHWDFNGNTMPSDYHFVYMAIVSLKNKIANCKNGCRYQSGGFRITSVDATYDMRLTTGDVLDIYYITSE